MLIANFADYYSTIFALNNGFIEANPFLNEAIAAGRFSLVKLIVPTLLVIYLIIRVKTPKSLQRVCNLLLFSSVLFTSVAVHNTVRVLLN